MNKVLLLYPPSTYILKCGFPLPLLSSYLKKYGHQVKVIDCPGLKMNFSNIIDEVRMYDPDIIGVSIPSTLMKTDGLKTLEVLRTEFPNKFIIAGGIHVTVAPEEVARLSSMVCLGYGHETLKEIVELYPSLEVFSLPGTAYMKNGMLIVNEWRPGNFNDMPIPDWDAIPFYEYNDFVITGDPSSRCFPVFSSMGCPYNCSFCSTSKMSGKKVLLRNIKDVVDEIEIMQRKTGFQYVRLIDPNFTINHKHVIEFCNEILHRNIKIKWGISTTVKNHTEELAKIMKKAGLVRIGFSYESCNEKILKSIGKHITKKEMYETTKLYFELGDIMIDSGFIIGFSDDSIETVWETISYSASTPIHNIFISFMCPFPGTEMYDIAKRKGEFAEKLLYDASPFEICYIPPGLKNYNLYNIKKFAFYVFYSWNIDRVKSWLARFKGNEDYAQIEQDWMELYHNRHELTLQYLKAYATTTEIKNGIKFYEPRLIEFSNLHKRSALLNT